MENNTELTDRQRYELLHVYDFLDEYSVSMSKVSSITGISRTTLTNKFAALNAMANDEEPTSRSRFTVDDYTKLQDFLVRMRTSIERLLADGAAALK